MFGASCLRFGPCDILGAVMASEYELMLVTRGDIEANAHEDLIKQVKELVESVKGSVSNVESWGKKNLAYKVKNQDKALYDLVSFSGEPATPDNLAKKLKLLDDLIRFLVVKKESQRIKSKK